MPWLFPGGLWTFLAAQQIPALPWSSGQQHKAGASPAQPSTATVPVPPRPPCSWPNPGPAPPCPASTHPSALNTKAECRIFNYQFLNSPFLSTFPRILCCQLQQDRLWVGGPIPTALWGWETPRPLTLSPSEGFGCVGAHGRGCGSFWWHHSPAVLECQAQLHPLPIPPHTWQFMQGF